MGTSSNDDDFGSLAAFEQNAMGQISKIKQDPMVKVNMKRDAAASDLDRIRIRNLRRRAGGVLANVNIPSSTLG